MLGEIGIGNTATTAALASLLTGAPASATAGRGSGLDAAGLERKRALVDATVALHADATTRSRRCSPRPAGSSSPR